MPKVLENDEQKYCEVENPVLVAISVNVRDVSRISLFASSSRVRMIVFCTDVPNVLRKAESTSVCDFPTAA